VKSRELVVLLRRFACCQVPPLLPPQREHHHHAFLLSPSHLLQSTLSHNNTSHPAQNAQEELPVVCVVPLRAPSCLACLTARPHQSPDDLPPPSPPTPQPNDQDGPSSAAAQQPPWRTALCTTPQLPQASSYAVWRRDASLSTHAPSGLPLERHDDASGAPPSAAAAAAAAGAGGLRTQPANAELGGAERRRTGTGWRTIPRWWWWRRRWQLR